MKKVFGTLLTCLLGLTLMGGFLKGQEAEAAKKNDEITIYLIRHGKTFFNTTGQVQGFADSPLTDKGISQAKKLGTGLKDIKFDLAYSSDLGRQRNTAKLILSKSDKKKPVLKEHDGFKEWNYGGYEGKTDKEMWEPIFEANGLKLDENWSDYEKLVEKIGDDGIANAIAANDPLKAAENYDEITTRGKAAMKTVIKDAKKAKAKNVMVVSSGSMIPTILELLVPEEYNGEILDNCSVTTLTYKDGKYTLDKVGDTQYIE
ncbi:histidine phosphatase family protein [Candidatus Enterococcus murrayae]|uniref:Histidine phosphatase family protein n=1 Tax=Candidatus Enterococcus murrayae TaxID=2815321 RepID=A0ABS3HFX9_9ENTE|nr:histidine phosphatase family protein [Enterococcus sp. MJM16]MBO0452356.1 histidine phosphatase family protein [Enterococcus sp. MJM16]